MRVDFLGMHGSEKHPGATNVRLRTDHSVAGCYTHGMPQTPKELRHVMRYQ
jgi:hypothetical protein